MKGDVQPNPTISNKYLIEIDGIPPFYSRKAGPFEKEVSAADAPDDTKHSGGRAMPGEATIETPIHHTPEFFALDSWFVACQFGAPGYKKAGAVHYCAANGAIIRSFELSGVWITKRALPEGDRTSDDLGFATWTLSFDDVNTIG